MAFTDLLCQRIHQRLASVSGANAVELNRTQTGLLDALISPINRQNLEAIAIDDGRGRRRTVRVFYNQQTPASAVLTSKPAFCTTQVAKEPLFTDVEADQVRYSPGRRLTDDDLQRICGEGLDEQGLLRDMLLTDIAAILESVNLYLWSVLATGGFGNHYANPGPPSNAAVNVPLLTNTGNPIYDGFSLVIQGYRRARGVGRPIVVGEGILDRYMRAVSNGCCNDGGIDLSRAVGEAFYFYDLIGPQSLGPANANNFATISPGSMHIVQWRKHSGPFQRIFDNSLKTTFIDPITGLEFELHLEWQGCEERWVWTVGMHFGVFLLPNAGPNTPWVDPFFTGANGTLRWNAQQLP